MSNKQLYLHIKKQLDNEVDQKEIRETLTRVGWKKDEIDEAFYEAGVDNDIPRPEPTPRVHSMWDAFEHIILFISLYVFATSFTLLVYAFIDRWVPKSTPYSPYSYFSSMSSGLLRSYLSAIIVSYPIFAFLFLRVNRKNLVNPSLRFLHSRKALIYFTLVVTFIITLISIISIVFSFLNGNVTGNFILRFMVTIAVSMTIFTYWTQQVKEDRHYA